MSDEINNTAAPGVVILAAGRSTRMGSPKQLLPYSATTLLQHTIDAAESSQAQAVTVVLGSNAGLIRETIKSQETNYIINTSFREGIASSIRCGIDELVKSHPHVHAVILMVADQPYVSATLLNQLIEQYLTKDQPIVASKYGETLGTPVLFDKRFWNELLQLKGDEGAKSLIYKYIDQAGIVPFPGGDIDIDTREDFNNLIKSSPAL
jgi:molybdenum cofactor cytidylyltransferase